MGVCLYTLFVCLYALFVCLFVVGFQELFDCLDQVELAMVVGM